MIRARRLFLFPAVTFIILSPLMLFAGVGLVVWLLLLSGWYSRNHADIELYFKGIHFRKHEYCNEEELK